MTILSHWPRIFIAAALLIVTSCSEGELVPSSGQFGPDNPRNGREARFFSDPQNGSSNDRLPLRRGTDQFADLSSLDNRQNSQVIVAPAGGQSVELNLVNASIPAAAEAVLGEALGLSYVVDNDVEGTVTIQTTGPVIKSVLLELFVAGLDVNGVRLEREGNVVKIVSGGGASRHYRSLNNASSSGTGIVVAPLKYISATQMVSLLQPSIEDGLKVVPVRKRNILLLSGNSAQIASAVDAMNLFDVDVLKGKSVALIRLDAAEPEAVVEELNLIFETAEGGALQDVVQFVPNPRLKSILVITTRSTYLADAQKWIRDLDKTAGGARRYSQIYELQNRSADELAPILDELMKGANSDGQSVLTNASFDSDEQTTASGQIQIIADDGQNAIVARALRSEHDELRRLIAQLDTSLKQVLLEATIAEVTLNEDLNQGVGWFFQNGNFRSTFSSNTSGAVGSQFPGFSAVFQSGNAEIALNALASITDVKVISSPTLMVLDNKAAILQIGDQVPIATRSAVDATNPNAPIVSTIDYRDTGVILDVRPRIGNGGRVVLDITQEVSDVAATTTSGIDSPTIRQRQVTTTVVVDDGATLALGGIIQERDNRTNSKVPGLGDVPVLGGLFRSKSKISLRTELLILIRPRVVRDSAEARAATQYWRDKLEGPNKILSTGLGRRSHQLPRN